MCAIGLLHQVKLQNPLDKPLDAKQRSIKDVHVLAKGFMQDATFDA